METRGAAHCFRPGKLISRDKSMKVEEEERFQGHDSSVEGEPHSLDIDIALCFNDIKQVDVALDGKVKRRY